MATRSGESGGPPAGPQSGPSSDSPPRTVKSATPYLTRAARARSRAACRRHHRRWPATTTSDLQAIRHGTRGKALAARPRGDGGDPVDLLLAWGTLGNLTNIGAAREAAAATLAGRICRMGRTRTQPWRSPCLVNELLTVTKISPLSMGSSASCRFQMRAHPARMTRDVAHDVPRSDVVRSRPNGRGFGCFGCFGVFSSTRDDVPGSSAISPLAFLASQSQPRP